MLGKRDRRRARVHRQHRLKVLDDVGVQAPHDTELVGHAAQMRKQLAHRQARFAVLREAEGRSHQRQHVGPAQMDGRDALPLVDLQARLGIERVDVRETAGEEDEDQMLGPRRMIRRAAARADVRRASPPPGSAADTVRPRRPPGRARPPSKSHAAYGTKSQRRVLHERFIDKPRALLGQPCQSVRHTQTHSRPGSCGRN